MKQFESKGRVLLVESDAVCRESLSNALKADRYEAFSAKNGREALKILQAQNADTRGFELLITEIGAVPMSGLELIREVAHRGIALPALALTGKGDEEHLVDLFRQGCADFIEKPFETAELLARVENLILNSRRKAESHSRADQQMILLARAWEHSRREFVLPIRKGPFPTPTLPTR